MILRGKLGQWELPHGHVWSRREPLPTFEPVPLFGHSTRVATIGSCFAEEVSKALTTKGFSVQMHPGGLFYNTASIRQELERVFLSSQDFEREDLWVTQDGRYVDPFGNYHLRYESKEELLKERARRDREAAELFRNAELIVMTLGLTETWLSRATGNAFKQIPHPDVFSYELAAFKNLSFAENLDNLERIYAAVRSMSKAPIVVTVSPIPLHATFTTDDVRIANTVSKSRLRACADEFCIRHDDVHYFHSYEIVLAGERQADFMLPDGRHVHRHGVELIVQQFCAAYGDQSAQLPAVATDWLSQPLAYEPPGQFARLIGRILPRAVARR